MKKGVPVSPGVAVARAYCINERLARHDPHYLEVADLSGEVSRLTRACAAAGRDLDTLIARVGQEIGEDEANIFRAHRILLRDPALMAKVKTIILTRKVDARTALQEALDEYSALFDQIQDEYLRERMADVRDVVGRILAQLSLQDNRPSFAANEPVIIVAPEILPSQAVAFGQMHIAGIVTETGGATGHAAILARSLSIPAVSGLKGILDDVNTGDLLAVDGREGHVYINPGPEVESAYRTVRD